MSSFHLPLLASLILKYPLFLALKHAPLKYTVFFFLKPKSVISLFFNRELSPCSVWVYISHRPWGSSTLCCVVFCLFLILVALPPRPLSSSASMNDPELLFPPGVTFLFPSPHQTRCFARHPPPTRDPTPSRSSAPSGSPSSTGPSSQQDAEDQVPQPGATRKP